MPELSEEMDLLSEIVTFNKSLMFSKNLRYRTTGAGGHEYSSVKFWLNL